jgi:HAD superfamily hydrolase (TIGR01662 family)
MKLHITGQQADWVVVSIGDRNIWQRLAVRSFGILTPANVISLTGLICVVIGLFAMQANHLWWGIGLIAIGRLADVVDGTVAEQTRTKGPVGEVVDAVSDKLAAILVICFFILNGWLPLLPLILVAAHVCINTLLASVAWIRKIRLHPTAVGKYSTVCAWVLLLIFPAAYAANQTQNGLHSGLLVAGYAVSIVFVFLALSAAAKYYRAALSGIERPNKTVLVGGVSGSRIIISFFLFVLSLHDRWVAIFILAMLAFVTDYLDGWLARKWKVVSKFGMTFDPLADKVVCLTLQQINSWYWVLFVIFAFYDSFTMTMRFVLPTPMPASKTAKLKTSLLMFGLLAMIVGLYSSLIAVFAGLILIGATVLTVQSLSGYIRNIVLSFEWLEFIEGVTLIDFPTWHKTYGIDTVLFDIDGTLTPWNEEVVGAEVLLALKRAKKSGISKVGLVSNMRSKKLSRLAAIAEQIGAVTYHLPRRFRTRKPSAFMINVALQESQSERANTAFVGDKIVDVLAARRAGLKRVAWVERLGTSDHISDRVIYRPIEKLFMRILR